MALIMCPLCTSEDDVQVLETLPDGRRRVECTRCNFAWDHGETPPAHLGRGAGTTLLAAQAKFPGPDDVPEASRHRATELKRQFLTAEQPEPDPRVAPSGPATNRCSLPTSSRRRIRTS